MIIPGQHPEYRQAGFLLDPFHPIGKQPQIAAETVDDEPGHAPAKSVGKAFQGAHQLGEDSPPVDVADQDDRCVGITGHGQVDDVMIQQVDFGTGTGALHHHQVVSGPQAVEGGVGRGDQPGLFPVVIHGRLVSDGLAQQHHLRAHVAGGLEQDGIHVHVGRDAGGLGLYDLGPSHLQTLGSDPGVVGHVLGLEGRHP